MLPTGLLSPPRFETEAQNTAALTLHVVLLSAGGIVLGLGLLVPWFAEERATVAVIYASIFLIVAVNWLFLRARQLRLAAVSFCSLMWLICIFLVWIFGGALSPELFTFIPIILITGVVWSERAAVVMVVLTALATLVMVGAESAGRLPPSLPMEPIRMWAGFSGALAMTAFLLIVGLRRLRAAADELRHSERQLQHAQKIEAVGRLAGGIAHDFNNLITAINGYSELAMRQLDAADPLSHHLAEIRKAGDRAAALTRQLLAFSRRQFLQPEVLELNDVVRDTEMMLRRVIGEDVELTTRLAPETGRVRIDPGQLEQVIVNLAVNARDAMPRGGRLILATEEIELEQERSMGRAVVPPGRYAVLAVEDTGHGMDEAVQEKLFEPFFTTKPKGAGTGLGLATVYGIVKQSEGFIFVDSGVGRGSRFTIFLPRLEEVPAPPAAEATPPAAHEGSGVILLVEDEAPVRDVACRILEASGYQVLAAEDAVQASQLVSSFPAEIELLITDVVLPGIGGRELAERLTAESKVNKVLFISGYAEEAIARHGVREQGDLLAKPFSSEELTRKVREVLAGQ